MKPTLALTMGDINGIGPEILAKALAKPEAWELCHPVVVGSAPVLEGCRTFAPACPQPQSVETLREAQSVSEHVPVLGLGLKPPARRPGVLDSDAGRCAVEWVKGAVGWALSGEVDGVVTCPINKEGIHRAGYKYPGHTELIGELTGSRTIRMSLFADTMRIVHITSHCSLREAIAQVRADRIAATIRIAHEALVRLGLPQKRIAVAGLNPHAGEAGAFGTEEMEEILPAIDKCKQEGIDCSGPHPADSVFRQMKEGSFELVVAMYHDQGHIPVKLIAMDTGVNITLGLPIVRTSVDHGTAFDIAGKGVAREDSLCAAIRLAAQLASSPRRPG